MKNNILTTIVAIAIYISTSAQTVHRVNNRTDLLTPIQGTNVYTTFSDAYNAAANGDIIYLEGSPISYGSLIISKQLHIVGTGYLLDDNLETQQYTNSSKVSFVVFKVGSEGSIIQSVRISRITINSNVSNISITGVYSTYSSYLPLVYLASGTDNITIEKSFLYNNVGYIIATDDLGSPLIIIRNNIIICGPDSYKNAFIAGGSNQINVFIKNNTILGKIDAVGATLINNVIIYGDLVNASSQFNNISNSNQLTAGNGNLENIDITTVFEMTGDPTKDSEYYNIKAGSPTIGAGFEGADVGHLGGGGDFPYVKSGLINFPAIYEATVPNITSGTLNIEIKTKSH